MHGKEKKNSIFCIIVFFVFGIPEERQKHYVTEIFSNFWGWHMAWISPCCHPPITNLNQSFTGYSMRAYFPPTTHQLPIRISHLFCPATTHQLQITNQNDRASHLLLYCMRISLWNQRLAYSPKDSNRGISDCNSDIQITVIYKRCVFCWKGQCFIVYMHMEVVVGMVLEFTHRTFWKFSPLVTFLHQSTK